MALSLGDAILWLKTNNKGLSDGLNKAERSTTGWASSLGGKIGPMIGGAVVGGVTLAVGAIAGVGAAAFGVANEVDAASKKMQGALNLTAEEAEKLGQVGLQVFGNNFAGSITEATDAVGVVKQQLGGLVDDADLQSITEDAFRLKDAFGVDVTDGVDAARTLMENFGVSAEQAFDLLASGYQQGLDRSGDFIDTIGEYSTQFASGGASAEEFFALLDSGMQGGMLGTDKAADAFKEFRVRILDGSKTTAAGLAMLGATGEYVTDGLANGSLTAADAFDEVIGGLRNIEDPAQRIQAGVALLGTQFEDLGDSALNMSLDTFGSFDNVAGSIDAVDAQYNTLGAAVEGFKRKFLVAMQPTGDKLLELANVAMPYVQKAFDWMADRLPGILDATGKAIGWLVDFVVKLFSGELTAGLGKGLAGFEFVQEWIEKNMPLIQETIEVVLTAIRTFWENNGEAIMGFVKRNLEAIGSIIKSVMQIILGVIRIAMLVITGDWAGAWEELKNVAEIWLGAVKTLVKMQLDNLVALITGLGGAFWDAGKSIIGGLWDGISSGFTTLIDNTKGKLKELRDLLPFSEPKDPASPLRGLSRSGAAIVGQIQAGIDGSSLDLGGALTPSANAAGGIASAAAGGGGARTLNITAPLIGSVSITNEADEKRLATTIIEKLEAAWSASLDAGTRASMVGA